MFCSRKLFKFTHLFRDHKEVVEKCFLRGVKFFFKEVRIFINQFILDFDYVLGNETAV